MLPCHWRPRGVVHANTDLDSPTWQQRRRHATDSHPSRWRLTSMPTIIKWNSWLLLRYSLGYYRLVRRVAKGISSLAGVSQLLQVRGAFKCVE